ncbi:hypothetical protein D3C72_2114780 [compost metagenome]
MKLNKEWDRKLAEQFNTVVLVQDGCITVVENGCYCFPVVEENFLFFLEVFDNGGQWVVGGKHILDNRFNKRPLIHSGFVGV